MLNGGAHHSFEVEATSYAPDRCLTFSKIERAENTIGGTAWAFSLFK
jgi:hypothetical protein